MEDEYLEYEDMSEEGNSDDDDNFVDGLEMEPSSSATQEKQEAEDFPYEIFTADQIVQFMVDSIKEVNAVVQVGLETVQLCSVNKLFPPKMAAIDVNMANFISPFVLCSMLIL